MRIANIAERWVMIITGVISSIILVYFLWESDWIPEQLIQVGTKYLQGDPSGTEGYDGQFSYAIAMNPNPEIVKKQLDIPSYRYQRILFPLIVRLLSFGKLEFIPWLLIIVPLLGHLTGTWVILLILRKFHTNPYYALVYGLGAGFLLSIRLALPEPLAYAFAIGALYLYMEERYLEGGVMLALAFFTKEVTLVFGIAYLIALCMRKEIRTSFIVFGISCLPFMVFQVWLWFIFGKPGLAAGGAMATSFEFIPFMGFFRIGQYSVFYMWMMILAFSPLVIMPSIYGFIISLRKIIGQDFNILTVNLLFNSLVMFFLPFSTYRETGGVLRLSCGLIASFLLFIIKENNVRILRYLPAWIVYNVFLLK